MPQHPLPACKYEVDNILFNFNIGLFLMQFDIFLHADNFFFSQEREIILKVLHGGSIKGDNNSRKQTLDDILPFLSPEMKDIPIEKHVWFKTLQDQKLPAIHNINSWCPRFQVSWKVLFCLAFSGRY